VEARDDLPVILLVSLLGAACLPSAAPPADANAYVRGLVSTQQRREEALSRYTYDVTETREDLDGDGRARRREERAYEVFFVRGRPVRRMARRDGRPLPDGEQRREDARVRALAADLEKRRAVTEQAGVRISKILERYDFVFGGREEREGRCTLVFDFGARPERFDLEHDPVLRRLAGRLWVDEQEHAIARVAVRNTAGIRIALGLAASVSSLAFAAEFARMEEGVWLPRRTEVSAEGRKLLFLSFRTRTTTVFAHYRRFDVDVEERVAP
jgi:hypothetical protein